MVTFSRKFFFHLLVQGTTAVIFMFLVLLCLDLVKATNLIWAAGASTLASTCFILFGNPHGEVAKPHRIFFGYLIAILCGHLIRLVVEHFCKANVFCHTYETHVFEVAAVFSMGLSFLLMIFTKSAHPPAAGLAVVMVLDISNINAMIVIGIAAMILTIIRIIFGKRMQPLTR